MIALTLLTKEGSYCSCRMYVITWLLGFGKRINGFLSEDNSLDRMIITIRYTIHGRHNELMIMIDKLNKLLFCWVNLRVFSNFMITIIPPCQILFIISINEEAHVKPWIVWCGWRSKFSSITMTNSHLPTICDAGYDVTVPGDHLLWLGPGHCRELDRSRRLGPGGRSHSQLIATWQPRTFVSLRIKNKSFNKWTFPEICNLLVVPMN